MGRSCPHRSIGVSGKRINFLRTYVRSRPGEHASGSCLPANYAGRRYNPKVSLSVLGKMIVVDGWEAFFLAVTENIGSDDFAQTACCPRRIVKDKPNCSVMSLYKRGYDAMFAREVGEMI